MMRIGRETRPAGNSEFFAKLGRLLNFTKKLTRCQHSFMTRPGIVMTKLVDSGSFLEPETNFGTRLKNNAISVYSSKNQRENYRNL